MRLSRPNRNRHHRPPTSPGSWPFRNPPPETPFPVHYEQPPTKASKALVAAVTTLLGLLGVTLSDGTTQLVAAIVQLLLVTYAVWRTVNAPKGPR